MAFNGLTLGRNCSVTIFDSNATIVLTPDEMVSVDPKALAAGEMVKSFGDPTPYMEHNGYTLTIKFNRRNNSTSEYWQTLEALFFGRININGGTIIVSSMDSDGVHEEIYTNAICTNYEKGMADASGIVSGSLEFMASRCHKI